MSPPDPARRQFLIGGALLATSAAAVALTPRTREAAIGPRDLQTVIPHEFGPWRFVSASGLVLPPSDETEARVYDQVLTRVYQSDDFGPNVMLMIAYGGGQTGMFEIHRPEACYPAQGYHLSDSASVPIALGDGRTIGARFWSAKSDVNREQLLYWTRIGPYFPATWFDEHVAIIRTNLARRLPDGVLVRMSIESSDRDEAIARLDHFAHALVSNLGPAGRRALIG